MRYTAAEFEWVAAHIDSGRAIEFEDYGVVSAALRIASRVMADGLIEAAVTQRLNDESSPTDDDLSAAIRAALLEDAGK